MRIAIYSPYLDTSGGGEKYILTIAEVLSKNEKVDVLLDEHLFKLGIEEINSKIEKLHGLDLSKVNFIKAPIGAGSNFFKRLLFLKRYDWLFYLTDGSLFYSTAKNSVVHFQVPFESSPQGYWGKIKLKSWQKAVYNSEFTKSYVEKTWRIPGEVIYPPVSLDIFKPLLKEKKILSVGRFFGYLRDKKHTFLIESFKKLVESNKLKQWSMHLAGGAGEGDVDYLNELQAMAKGFDIHFYPNATLTEVAKLYGESQLYWHASGFGETDPKKFEHFGITVVEAMSAGCIPVVIDKGGLTEIVENGKSGYLWDTQDQLLDFTSKLIGDQNLTNETQKQAVNRSKQFGKQFFNEKIKKLIYG